MGWRINFNKEGGNDARSVWADAQEYEGETCQSCGAPREKRRFLARAGRGNVSPWLEVWVETRDEAINWCQRAIRALEKQIKYEEKKKISKARGTKNG